MPAAFLDSYRSGSSGRNNKHRKKTPHGLSVSKALSLQSSTLELVMVVVGAAIGTTSPFADFTTTVLKERGATTCRTAPIAMPRSCNEACIARLAKLSFSASPAALRTTALLFEFGGTITS